MKKKVYIVQPSYRKMDRSVVKGSSLIINCTLNVSMLMPTIPDDWEKSFCLENFDEIDYNSDATVVFLSTTSSDVVHAYRVAKIFKTHGKIVFFGGHQETMSLEVMRSVCDAFYFGVPDKHWMEKMLTDVLNQKIKKEYHCGINIDFPFDYSVFKGKKIDHLIAMSSIGCKYRCDYCQHQVQYDGVYKLRNIDCIIEDIKSIKKYTKVVAFRDANFYLQKDHVIKLCDRIIAEKINIKWGAQCPISIGQDPEVLHKMAMAGCRALFIGYESLNQDNLSNVHKPVRADKYREYTKNIRKSGIYVIGYFMFGFDYDTYEAFDDVYRFIREMKISVPLMNLYTPVPGTRLFNRLKSENRLKVPSAENFVKTDLIFSIPCSRCHFIPKMASTEELEKGFAKLYQKLTLYPEILRRSVGRNFIESVLLFKMNLDLRSERKKLATIFNKDN